MLGPWVVPLILAAGEPPAEPCVGQVAGMACVPGGSFIRGDDESSRAHPRASVWLSTYYIDVFEVTTADYRRCVVAGECNDAAPRYADFDAPNQPMHGVSWYDAASYCSAMGKHLPTEAQWEKAARGPDGATYPWGDEPATCTRAIVADRSGRGCGVQKRGNKPETGKPWPVGSRPAGVYGLHDMAGNAFEWVADWAASSYAACGDDCRGPDPLGPCGGAEFCEGHARKVVRGGSWYWGPNKATATYRRFHVPDNEPFHHFGFRCAASIDEAKALLAKRR